jgi:hypothetical protein
MSTRESGSDTWPRFAAFPGDNLDLGNVSEEEDVDHRAEPPSWLSGSATVGTGADPPDLDQGTEEQDADGHAYAAESDNGEAPGFADIPVAGSGFGQASPDGPGFGDIPVEPPDFEEVHVEPPGFGGVPGGAPGFGAAQGTDSFAGQASAGFGGPAEPGQGYRDGHGQQRSEYGGDYQGEYGSEYRGGGYGAAPAGGSYGGGPAVSTMYGDGQAYQTAQENGAGTAAPPFPGQYPPVEPPKSRMTASLRAVRRGRPSGAKKRARPGRQAQLTVARVEPWSVMKFSFVISLVAFIILFVAVAVLYAVLSSLGVFEALQRTVQSITSSQSASGFSLSNYLSASRVLGYTGLLGALNVVLITALSTVGAVLYNITADLAGGVEITLKETD